MRSGEFVWKHANPGKGVLTAIVHSMKYLLLPMVLVIVCLFTISRTEGAEDFEGLLQEIRTLVLIFGSVLVVLGFFKGAYPKGSYSRLTFGMAVAVLTIVYVYSLLLDGRSQDIFSDNLFELDLELLFTFYFIVAVFTVFMQFGEFIDHRQAWLEGTAQVVIREKEDPERHRWFHDFRLRYGSLYNGLKLSRGALLGFVLIPMAVVMVMKAGFSSLNSDEVDTLLGGLDRISTYLIMLGLPMAALAFLKGFYPRGSVSRFLPATAMTLIGLYWLWVLGLEGKLVIESIENINISLDFSALLLLLVIANSLWIVYHALELWLYRTEWREGGFRKDLGDRKKKRGRADDRASKVDAETALPQENSSS